MRTVTLALSLGLLLSVLGCGGDESAQQQTCPVGQVSNGTSCQIAPTCAAGSILCGVTCVVGTVCPAPTGTGGSVGTVPGTGTKPPTTPATTPTTLPSGGKPSTGVGGAPIVVTNPPPAGGAPPVTTVPGTTKPTGTGGSAPGTTSAPYVDPDPESCTDTATVKTTLSTDYGRIGNITTNVPGKTYGLGTNWWGKFDGQTITVNGLGFTVGNPKNVSVGASGAPAGFPTILIGQYQQFNTRGSNLPKLVSTIKSIPVVFETNIGNASDANATFDVWFNTTATPLTMEQTDPTGGFIMVWMHKPSNRQPRGSIRISNATVAGVAGTWNVWADNKCVSYVNTAGIQGLTFDLNKFIKHAVENKVVIQSSWYLNTIFGGFEIWGGGDGLQLKKFCAKVN